MLNNAKLAALTLYTYNWANFTTMACILSTCMYDSDAESLCWVHFWSLPLCDKLGDVALKSDGSVTDTY